MPTAVDSHDQEKLPRKSWYRFIAWVARRIVFTLLGGVKVLHQDRVPSQGPVLIAPIHVSFLDPPIVGCTCRRQLRFMAKEELFRVPLLSPLIKSLGAFPVRRGESDTAAIRKTMDWLESGQAVLVFPEGQRGDGLTMGAVQPGIAVLAKRTKAVIVPVGLSGTEHVLPKGKKGVHPRPMTVVYGEPFTYESSVATGSGVNERQRFANELARRISEACKEAGMPVKICESNLDQATLPQTQTPS